MAEAITIPSPSVFLSSPVEAAPQHPPSTTAHSQPPGKRRPSSTPKASRADGDACQNTTANPANGVTKRKQSKSRNGCITCKAKRLKCDETKPTCQQCARRSVTCGGYKKDFKWRPFEEASFTGSKPQPAKPRKGTPPPAEQARPAPANRTPPTQERPPPAPALTTSDAPFAASFAPASQPQSAPLPPSFMDVPLPHPGAFFPPPPPSPFMLPPDGMPMPDPFEQNGSTASTTSMFNDAETVDTMQSATTDPSNMNAPSPEYLSWRAQYPDSLYQPTGFEPPALDPMDEDDVEDIARQPIVNPDHEAWVMRLPSPIPSDSSSSSGGATPRSDPFNMLLREPRLALDSPELMTWRFDQQTCGILSVKDGPTENPWRTLIWPLAKDSPALYHAIASMTNFHTSKHEPQLRVQGIEHMRTSIEALATGIQNMRVDTAIATTLALAFSETWDQHTSTGIDHIKGAKILVHQALIRHQRSPVQGDELARLKFLCHTWVYMDVIARLTSVDDDESNDFDAVTSMFAGPFEYEAQLDPLMGCASTLFPIIGYVANLVRRVRRSESNSPAVISQAMELKTQLEDWVPQAFFEVPEDPTSQIQHSLQTAEAYRWATLLYLHQAVPEIPSLSSAELAKKVLIYLATVPLTSRAVIVHIYPLMAAGCEAATDEDRQWVRQRWESMSSRMVIGIIDRCLDITKEVWARRDVYAARVRPKAKVATKSSNPHKRGASPNEEMSDEPVRWNENFVGANKRRATIGPFDIPRPSSVREQRRSSTDFGTGIVDREFTVRGRLHWLSVMKDWGWEG
ncbi:c6 finger domain-containing protein [Neofusicoccum parvum]|uniref:Putative c6 finger domain-containing protein n=1 Tax=Botryosphaeria parva (strain UCR-NP2) TaxID=1287680 RepID=R1GB23_BOTPV|nr:putative c6 finger domain-containing protein [Neofusicoccum parvum UCRNP2]GME30372.1 c6 finger domain-containing protein [Neofusicoccum parvum]